MLLTIPKRHKKPIVYLIELPPERVRALIDAIQKTAPTVSLYDLTAQLYRANLGIDFDELFHLLSMLASLYRVRSDMRLAPTDFVQELTKAILADADLGKQLQQADW